MRDKVLGYRICSYNDAAHGGPHIHLPTYARAGVKVPVRDAAGAERLLDAFARQHSELDEVSFHNWVKKWKSA